MNAPLSAAGLVLDAIFVAGIAWMLVRRLAPELERALELALAWGLAALATIAGAGVVLGEIGGLHLPGFLTLHAALLAGLAVGRRPRLAEDLAAARGCVVAALRPLRASRTDAVLLGSLAVVAVGFVVLGFLSEPVVFDALSYRLPRLGHWLQEGRVGIVDTDDARLGYLPVVPDLVVAWLLAGSGDGFRPAAWAQTCGGLLFLGATFDLARLTGLGRRGAAGAAWLALGLPNVVPQFTSAYTDLFTAGVLSSGFVLWLRALQRGHGSWPGGLAAGLAAGSKGTVAYLAPAILPVLAWLAWRHRVAAGGWRRTLAGALLSAAVFVGPFVLRNVAASGGPFGPREFVDWHHGTAAGWAEAGRKLQVNLASSLAQLCEPNSQPPWWRLPVRTAGEALVRELPQADPYAFDGIDRRANLEKVFAVAAPDADVATTGVLLPALALAAGAFALLRRRGSAEAALVVAWSLVVAGFVVVLHGRLQWHPYLFRFVLLVVPWLAVVAAWGLAALPGRWRLAAALVVGLGTGHGFVAGTFHAYQAGWLAATDPGRSFGAYVHRQWREWSFDLASAGGPLRPHLPVNRPLAAFYRRPGEQRTEPGRLSALPTGSDLGRVLPGNGWLIVPAAQFLGREGRAVGRTWLLDGDERNPFSLAAYRAAQPGEIPPPVLYRNRVADAGGRPRRELLVRTWSEAPLRLELLNRGANAVAYELRSPLGTVRGTLPPRSRQPVEVPVPANFPTLLALESPPADGVPAGETVGVPEVRLLP